MTFKEANEQVQPVSLFPRQAVFSRSPQLARQWNVLPQVRRSWARANGFAYLLLACPTFYHCCCCSLSPHKRKEDPETLHPICLSTRQACSSQEIKLSVTILQTQPPVSLQGSQYLPAVTSSYSITNANEVLHPLLYFRLFCSSASPESL